MISKKRANDKFYENFCINDYIVIHSYIDAVRIIKQLKSERKINSNKFNRKNLFQQYMSIKAKVRGILACLSQMKIFFLIM